MPKNLIVAITVCLLLGFAGAGILGWMYISRDRVAVASYRVVLEDGVAIADLVEKEAELITSGAVLKPVVEELDLVNRWELNSEEEALTRIRSKLKMKAGSTPDRVKVIFRDRSQKRALEILAAINRQFAARRHEAALRKELPPVVPLEEQQPATPPGAPPTQ